MKKKHFFFDKQLEKPIFRPNWRRQLGKLFYQLKRKINWHFSDKTFSKVSPTQFFENEIARPPRAWAEKIYNIEQWNQYPGGHFAALENSEILASDIFSFAEKLKIL